jgi:hypothetical protein
VAGALWAGVLLTGFNAWVAAGILGNARIQDDFRLDYLAVRLVVDHGWRSLYDFAAQRAQAQAFGFNWQPFVSPPPLAALAAPFAALPFDAALVLWTALLVGALAGGWWLAAPGGTAIFTRHGRLGPERWMHLAIAFGLFPAAFAIAIGQPAPVVLLALAAAWWLLRSGREGAAGLCVAVLVVKPQLALLVPATRLVAGRWRAAAVAAGAGGAIAILSGLAIGPHGISSYLDGLSNASGWALTRRFTLADVLGPAFPVSQVAVVALTLVAAWRARAAGPEIPLAAGIAGSLLVTPYIGIQDFTLLLLAGWLVLRTRPPTWMLLLLGLGYPVLELALAEGSLPVVLWRSALLVGLAALPSHPHDHGAQAEAEGRVEQGLVEKGEGQRAGG